MAINEAILASQAIHGVKPDLDVNGNPVPCRIVVDDSYNPPRLVFELPDRALRDLGVATVDGAVSLEISTLYSGSTALTPKFAFANVNASSTDSSIVAAVTAKRIRVLAVAAVAGATATTLTFNTKPAGAGSAISPLLANGANGGEILPFSPVGWFQTASGEGLTVTTGSGSATGVLVVYVEV